MKKGNIILILSSVFLTVQFLSVHAAAYIDASALTMTIQVITGIIIAIGAALGVLIVRLKKKAKDKFGIDVDAKKDKEEPVMFVKTDEISRTDSNMDDHDA